MENGKYELLKLNQRSNFLTFGYKDKAIVLFEDHRCVLQVLKYALEKKIIQKAINLVSFDYHSDSYDHSNICGPKLLEKERIEQVKNMTLQQFWNYVEFEHSYQDDDWLVSGMEYGLISDLAMLFVQENSNYLEFNKSYKNHTGNSHLLISINSNSKRPLFNKF